MEIGIKQDRQSRENKVKPSPAEARVIRVLVINPHSSMQINCDKFRSVMDQLEINIDKEEYLSVPSGTIRLFTLTAGDAGQQMVIAAQARKTFGQSLHQHFLY